MTYPTMNVTKYFYTSNFALQINESHYENTNKIGEIHKTVTRSL